MHRAVFRGKAITSRSSEAHSRSQRATYLLVVLAGDSSMSESDSDDEAVEADQDEGEWASESEAGQWLVFYSSLYQILLRERRFKTTAECH